MDRLELEKAITIDQSQLDKVDFTEVEVLVNPLRKQERKHRLIVASTLKNLGKEKVSITFRSLKRGLLKVISPIESAGKEFIVLKGGEIIPVKSIVKINL